MPITLSPGPMRITLDRETWEDRRAECMCHRCGREITEEDASPDHPDLHDECRGQSIGEELLYLGVERLADELAEEIADYSASRIPEAESARTRLHVELLRGAVNVMRGMLGKN